MVHDDTDIGDPILVTYGSDGSMQFHNFTLWADGTVLCGRRPPAKRVRSGVCSVLFMALVNFIVGITDQSETSEDRPVGDQS